jgi:CDP-glucose 4,6-dehydratase
LLLAEKLYAEGSDFAESWNFGPVDEDARSVQWIIERLSELCDNVNWQYDSNPQPHEAHYLKLDSSKAIHGLHWHRYWRLTTALQKTLEWHKAFRSNQDMRVFTLNQINEYLMSQHVTF